jgi:hypothetical protein
MKDVDYSSDDGIIVSIRITPTRDAISRPT